VVLEDDDVSLTIVPGPAQRNLERLARTLKRAHAKVDVVVGDGSDGRWSAYYEEAERIEPRPGLQIDVVADAPILRVRVGDARAAMPELALTQRERDRMRLKRRRALRRDERRSTRRRVLGR
jgi:hypothetical protein